MTTNTDLAASRAELRQEIRLALIRYARAGDSESTRVRELLEAETGLNDLFNLESTKAYREAKLWQRQRDDARLAVVAAAEVWHVWDGSFESGALHQAIRDLQVVEKRREE